MSVGGWPLLVVGVLATAGGPAMAGAPGALPGALPVRARSVQSAQSDTGLSTEALDRRAQEFMRILAAGVDEKSDVVGSDLAEFFSAKLLEGLPAKRIDGMLPMFRDEGEARFELLSSEPLSGEPDLARSYRYHLIQANSAWSVDLSLDSRGELAGWFMRPGALARSRVELDAATEALFGEWGLFIRLLDEDGGTLLEVDAKHGAELMPLASIFKLYVLAELCRQVAAGEVDLDAELPIREEAKSLPSGFLHTFETGRMVSIREMAALMIAISDNTAADHLLDLVGRDRVEAHLAEYGNSDPVRNTPFLSTSDLFLLKGGGKKLRGQVFDDGGLSAVAEDWAGGTPEERRAWLAALWKAALSDRTREKLRKKLLISYSMATMGARNHYALEWMARPEDIANLVTAAHNGELVNAETSRLFLELYAEGAPQYTLAGVVDHGFKGGGETWVLTLSTRVALEDGRAVVACLFRSGMNTSMPGEAERTSGLLNSWIRWVLEGDPERGD